MEAQNRRRKGVEWLSGDMPVSTLRPETFVGPERLDVFAPLCERASTGHNSPFLVS